MQPGLGESHPVLVRVCVAPLTKSLPDDASFLDISLIPPLLGQLTTEISELGYVFSRCLALTRRSWGHHGRILQDPDRNRVLRRRVGHAGPHTHRWRISGSPSLPLAPSHCLLRDAFVFCLLLFPPRLTFHPPDVCFGRLDVHGAVKFIQTMLLLHNHSQWYTMLGPSLLGILTVTLLSEGIVK